ncbi:unnamed protein product [Penicillium olsonii]|nr:unnamed protein product [Penicillium olsonii]CAG7928825.1 unnamed protein product [Penicillium olsonii]
MASHPAMLLDPKGAKRQAQANGNHSNSYSPSYAFPSVDSSPNEAGEPPKDFPSHLNRSSDPDPALPLSPGSSEIFSSAFSLPAMDPPDMVHAPGGAEAETCTPVMSQQDLESILANVPDIAEKYTPAISQMDSHALVEPLSVPVDSASNPVINIGSEGIPADSLYSGLTRILPDSQGDVVNMLAESTGPASESPRQMSFGPEILPAMANISSEESAFQGLLFDHTGKQSMAPAGTATVTRRHGPAPRTPITVDSGPLSPPAQTSDSLEVQFSTTQDEENESDAKRSYHELSDDEDTPDRRNLIADVYGAEERKRQNVKRVKTANEQSDAANAQISMSGSNGLGKWMKEGEKTPSSSAVFDTVDLTNGKASFFGIWQYLTSLCVLDLADTPKDDDDDDEIQCTGSTDLSTQRVCYGKIDGALIQSSFVPKPADSSIFVDQNSWPSMKIELSRPPNSRQGDTQINVTDPHGFIFGKIDPKTAQGLCPLLDGYEVSTVDVTARLNTRRKLPGEVVWAPTSGFWHTTINVYGQRQRADAIGKFLSHRNSCDAKTPPLLPPPPA